MEEKRALVENDLSPNYEPGATAPCGQQSQLIPSVQPVVQQPIVLQVTIPKKIPKIKDNYKAQLSRRFGIAQLVLGSVAVILNIAGIVIHATTRWSYEDEDNPGYYHYPRDNTTYYIGAGLWCPLLFFSLSGAFALGAAYRKTSCMIITNMVLCIMSSIFAFVMLVFACVAFGLDIHIIYQGFRYSKDYSYSYDGSDDESWPYEGVPNYCSAAASRAQASMVVSTLWVLVSLAEFIVCVWTATLCCRVMCCVNNANNTEPSMSARYTVNTAGSVQPQLLVLDSQGRPITGAQVIQIPGSSGTQHIQTCQGGQPQAIAAPGESLVKQGPDLTLPPPYEV